MSHRVLILVVLLALVGFAPATLAQDGSTPPGQLNAALQDLAGRLGRTVTVTDLDSWAFTSDFYTNTNLGCPLVSGTDEPQGITGFTFTVVADGVTYEYRVSADSSIVIPCSQNLVDLAPQPTGEVTPGNLTPTVTGEACPEGFVGLLTPRVTPNSRAEIVGGAPSRLRSGPGLTGTQITLINPGTVIDITGGPICADQYVWWQASVDGQSGWVAEGTLPDVYFIAPVAAAETVTPQATATAAATAEVTAVDATVTPVPATVGTATPVPEPGETVIVESGNLPELAAVVDNTALTTFDIASPDAVTPVTEVTAFSPESGPAVVDLAWSPDGRYLVYAAQGEGGTYDLYLTDVAGSEPALLASDLFYPMPVTFSAAGTQVYFARPGGDATAPTENGVTVNVFVQDLMPDAEASLAGTFMFGVGCGGGSPYPGDAVYNWEAGYGGRGSVFEMTPYGLVYSTNCTGSGTGLLDLQTGVSTELGANLSRVSPSPDGERLVAVQDNTDSSPGGVLTVVDLATLTLTPLGTVAEPDQVAWGGQDIIYYSTRTEGGLVVPGSDSDSFETDFGIPDGVPSYDVTVHRVDLAQTTDAEIWSGTGWAVPRMYATPDGGSLFFSLIPAGEDWVNAVNAGTFTPEDNAEPFHYPVLFRMDLSAGEAEQVAENLVMPTFNPAAFAAPAEPQTVG